MEEYYEKVTSKEIEEIENNTHDQSLNESWYSERRKRLTRSIFGDIMRRNRNNTINSTQRLLYTKFTGNKFTIKGLNDEERGEHFTLEICQQNPFLGASSDGIC